MFLTKNGTLTLIKGDKMPELDSVKICKLYEEAQAKIDSKAEYREKILHFLHNDDLFRIAIQMFRPETPYILKK